MWRRLIAVSKSTVVQCYRHMLVFVGDSGRWKGRGVYYKESVYVDPSGVLSSACVYKKPG